MTEIFARLPAFADHHAMLFALLGAIITALLVTELLRLNRRYHELTPAKLTYLINRDNALLVDLSSANDYHKGHIPGARHVEMAQFDPESKLLAPARALPVVVICKNGAQSAKAAQRLVKAGFTHVNLLGGGVDAWRRANLPLATGKA